MTHKRGSNHCAPGMTAGPEWPQERWLIERASDGEFICSHSSERLARDCLNGSRRIRHVWIDRYGKEVPAPDVPA